MIERRRTIYVLILLAFVLGVTAYVAFARWPSQAKDIPTLVYFYSGT